MTEIPRPEHPRPDLARKDFLNLNGIWRFAFDPEESGEKEGWFAGELPGSQTIQVPFPWESRLSGIHCPDYTGVAWYQREIGVPAEWEGQRVFLVFGAVDHEARVWIDEHPVTEHAGGYTPFEVELTDLMKPGRIVRVTVRVLDRNDPKTLTGKQVNWYTHTSGLWQTVYLEPRGEVFLETFHAECRVMEWKADLHLSLSSNRSRTVRYEIVSEDASLRSIQGTLEAKKGLNEIVEPLSLPDPRTWTPETPHLYPVRITLKAEDGPPDTVSTYFGFREISTGPYGPRGVPSILLNGKPVYLLGALHQAFHPDGIYTYPSDELIRQDLEKAKRMGLNCLRVHIKAEEPRFYYWADRLGVLILYDLPGFWEHSEAGRRLWEKTFREVLKRDRMHPSIFCWVLFNESWGIGNGKEPRENYEWVDRMVKWARGLDRTRPIEDNSPCLYDHVDTDLNTWHFYLEDYEQVKAHIAEAVKSVSPGSPWNFLPGFFQSGQPFFNSEYGAVSAGGGDRDISWGMKMLTNEMRLHGKIQGYIYTELTDIEWEHNGLLKYDRTPKEFGYDAFVPGMTVADVHRPDYLAIDAPPYRVVPPGENVSFALFLSHFSGRTDSSLLLRWELIGVDRFGEERLLDKGETACFWEPFSVTPAGTITVTAPEERMLCTFRAWVENPEGERLAVNYVHLDTDAKTLERERLEDGTWVLHFSPDHFSESSWEPEINGKFSGTGAGFVEYRLDLPEEANLEKVTRIEFLAELAARAGAEKLNWPQRINPQDYPQTSSRNHPSEVTVSINGIRAGTAKLPDDPADARGILSHARGLHHGSYGYLKRFVLDLGEHPDLSKSLKKGLTIRLEVFPGAGLSGGLSIYGEKMGRYPVGGMVGLY